MSYSTIKELNDHIRIHLIDESAFGKYGAMVRDYDFSQAIAYMKEFTRIPEEGNLYVPSEEGLTKTVPVQSIEERFYGEMPCQVGYCNGLNSTLNGMEYHKGSELLVAVTDLVLLLGQVQDVEEYRYPSSKAEAFFVPAGASVELFATTLHFSPCKVDRTGFKSIIILPMGTNIPLENSSPSFLFAKNKWLLVHPEAYKLRERGAITGIVGDNIRINWVES